MDRCDADTAATSGAELPMAAPQDEGHREATDANRARAGWTKRKPNDGSFATSKQSRGRIGGVRRER